MTESRFEAEEMEMRFSLIEERLQEIPSEVLFWKGPGAAFAPYFARTASQLSMFVQEYHYLHSEERKAASLQELKEHNHRLYEDILPGNYEKSYADPVYSCAVFGDEYGRLLSVLTYECRSLIGYLYREEPEEALIRFELFAEVYSAFAMENREYEALKEKGAVPEEMGITGIPSARAIRQKISSYYNDYLDSEVFYDREQELVGNEAFHAAVIMESDLSDLRYLYSYGDYISDNEMGTAAHLASLDESVIRCMADTYTQGYIKGFEATGKDLASKKTVAIVYPYGFERMVRQAVRNFEAAGKHCIFPMNKRSLFGQTTFRCGSAPANPQYDYDHKEDLALILDESLNRKRLDTLADVYRELREETVLFAGPAVIESFGQKPFSPKVSDKCLHYNAAQQKLSAVYRSGFGRMYNEAVIGKNRSFTIISFPVPEIAEDPKDYPEIFNAIIGLNTLDYEKYMRIQQTIIDTLDQADTLHVLGRGANRTDLTVNLWKLEDPSKETIFENCVADVNIPVGEVFTSPVLKGTNGLLHVTGVFLEGLYFKDLSLTFQDGCVVDYHCGNFEGKDKEEKGRAYIEDNILFHHTTLPMGECAIGTNTTAYAAGRKYGIEDRLPILIAEKTGPHFAVGDTCYSDDEDNIAFNPDGKMIVAKENDFSRKRNTDPQAAYFACHTDITIPYEEIGSITAVSKNGAQTDIIRNGRFVLPGTEELNIPLDECISE